MGKGGRGEGIACLVLIDLSDQRTYLSRVARAKRKTRTEWTAVRRTYGSADTVRLVHIGSELPARLSPPRMRGISKTPTGMYADTATPDPSSTARHRPIHSTEETLIQIHSCLFFGGEGAGVGEGEEHCSRGVRARGSKKVDGLNR